MLSKMEAISKSKLNLNRFLLLVYLLQSKVMYFVSHKSQIIFLRKERIYLNLANVLPIIYTHAEFQNCLSRISKDADKILFTI